MDAFLFWLKAISWSKYRQNRLGWDAILQRVRFCDLYAGAASSLCGISDAYPAIVKGKILRLDEGGVPLDDIFEYLNHMGMEANGGASYRSPGSCERPACCTVEIDGILPLHHTGCSSH